MVPVAAIVPAMLAHTCRHSYRGTTTAVELQTNTSERERTSGVH